MAEYNPYFMDAYRKRLESPMQDYLLAKEKTPLTAYTNRSVASGEMGTYVAPVSYESNAGVYDKATNIQENKPVQLNATSQGGVTSYRGHIGTEGGSKNGYYNYGININKTEGQPIGYGGYAGIGNEDYRAQLAADSQGGAGISAQYTPLGLSAYYNYMRNQNPQFGVRLDRSFNF